MNKWKIYTTKYSDPRSPTYCISHCVDYEFFIARKLLSKDLSDCLSENNCIKCRKCEEEAPKYIYLQLALLLNFRIPKPQ